MYYVIQDIVSKKIKNKYCLNNLKKYLDDKFCKENDINKIVSLTQEKIDKLEEELDKLCNNLLECYKKVFIKTIKSCKTLIDFNYSISHLYQELIKSDNHNSPNNILPNDNSPNDILPNDKNNQNEELSLHTLKSFDNKIKLIKEMIKEKEDRIRHFLDFQNFLIPYMWTNFHLYQGKFIKE